MELGVINLFFSLIQKQIYWVIEFQGLGITLFLKKLYL